jgi:hypothetical protein
MPVKKIEVFAISYHLCGYDFLKRERQKQKRPKLIKLLPIPDNTATVFMHLSLKSLCIINLCGQEGPGTVEKRTQTENLLDDS